MSVSLPRIDKWLWAARFYKTRSLASEAVSGGHVHLNGQRCKAAKPVQVGDEIRITKGTTQFTIIIEALSDKRGSAQQANTLYSETEQSIEHREMMRTQRKLDAMANPRPSRKPDKRQRRQIKEWQDKL